MGPPDLIVTLPSQPNAVRLRVWRSLKNLGCAALRDGAYLLPSDHVARLDALAAEVREHGGTASVLALPPRDAAQRDEVAMIPGARWCDPGEVSRWAGALGPERDVVVYCVVWPRGRPRHGDALARRRPQGALFAWRHRRLAERRPAARRQSWPGSARSRSMKWITRERPKIDRIACPWLITRFIDRAAEFLYVPAADVLRIAEERSATPYDIPGVEMSHVGELCSFDAFLAKYRLDDPALRQLALIVRGADTSRLDLTPQSAGLYAISLGLSQVYSDDHEMLRHGMVMYEALYAWCKSCQGETHQWPPAMR